MALPKFARLDLRSQTEQLATVLVYATIAILAENVQMEDVCLGQSLGLGQSLSIPVFRFRTHAAVALYF